MGQRDRDNSRWFGSSWFQSRRFGPVLAVVTAGLALFGLPALAQHTSGPAGGPAGHISAQSYGVPVGGRQGGAVGGNPGGHVFATRPMAPGRSFGTATRGGQPFGTLHGNFFGTGTMHANSFGAASPPPQSWELPRTVVQHWETSNIPIQPNAVQGNPIPRQGRGFGVGYVGLPYYVDPMAFVNAGDDQGDDTAQQAQPGAPALPDYGPQAPNDAAPEGPYQDQGYQGQGYQGQGSYSGQGYAPPRRAPYNPEGYPPAAQNNGAVQSAAPQSAAAPDDGLDHPAVTLVFNDGRPPMQVHSYVLTGSSVLIAEKGHQRVIPVTDLDLPATVAQNRDAGVDFRLPGGGK
jgi:hypothetical protein